MQQQYTTQVSTGSSQRGVALALLLWMIAAMSLLVGGLVTLSRNDVQLTALQLDQARSQAAATGIAHLAMRDLSALTSAGSYDGTRILQGQYQLDGLQLQVTIIPASGLVSINSAEQPLLETLLHFAAGLSEDEAAMLALNIIDWRGGQYSELEQIDWVEDGRGAFRVEEELLEVPGMNRDIYEAIYPFVHAQAGGNPELDLSAAPRMLLDLWPGGEAFVVDFAAESRQDVAPDGPASVQPAFGGGGGGIYCVDVDVVITQNRVFRQRIWVDMSSAAGGLPWRFTRVYPVKMHPATSREA
jgi:general secretion pathway protein K